MTVRGSETLNAPQHPCWDNDSDTMPLSHKYHKTANISCTKFQKSNDSHVIMQLSLTNPLKSGVKSRMMEQRLSALLQLHLSDQQVYAY